jgi:hypothetical protein
MAIEKRKIAIVAVLTAAAFGIAIFLLLGSEKSGLPEEGTEVLSESVRYYGETENTPA